jgi:hypothetical protein
MGRAVHGIARPQWWLSPEVEKIAAEVQDGFIESDVATSRSKNGST